MIQEITAIIGAFVLSAICGVIFIPALLKFCKKKNLYDIPSVRKVHKSLIPRLGGISFMPSMIISSFLVMFFLQTDANNKIVISTWTYGFLICLLIIYSVGIVDDLIGLDAKVKFTIQIVAASIIPFCGLYINNLYGLFGIHEIPFWIGAPLTVFLFVFIDNAMNLIDGIDGLSASLSIMSLIGILYCFFPYHLTAYEILISSLMGILVTYLYFNIWGSAEKGNKIFMGDSGSLTLGFILAFLFIKAMMVNPNVMPMSISRVVIAYSLLVVPTFDVVRVSIHRFRNHRPIFDADRNHIHHKLMAIGMNQHQALLSILLLEICLVAINCVMLHWLVENITYIFMADICIYTLYHVVLTKKIKRIGEEHHG